MAVLPAYLAAGTAVLVLLADLLLARRAATLATAAGGAFATAVAAVLVGTAGDRATFCVPDGCSWLTGGRSALVAALFALLTLAVLGLSAPVLRAGAVPAGEYCFLLACSMTGGVVLGSAGDLVTLVVAVETLTLPLYVLVALRRTTVAGAEAAVTFFVVSVVATAVALLGAALLYATAGTLHLARLGAVLAESPADPAQAPLTRVAVALLVLGLAFKVAAVPLHAWAPATYDGAPLPVAAYLSTASKLGGVVALLAVVAQQVPDAIGPAPAPVRPVLPPAVTAPVLLVLAVLSMVVGNLVALRQERTVRLLAWSSIAQVGYLLAPLGVLTAGGPAAALVAATVTYTVFYLASELVAFASLVALRPADADGGAVADLRGAARRHPWAAAAFVLALAGLAGLPPGLAGLFAKVTVVRALLGAGAGWLAVVVAATAVVGLAYYVRLATTLYAAPEESSTPGPGRPPWPVPAVVALAAVVVVVVGFAPQLVLAAAGR